MADTPQRSTVDEVLNELAPESVRAERVQEYHAGERDRRRVKTQDLLVTLERADGRLVATRSNNAGETHIGYAGEGRDPWLVWSHSEIHARALGKEAAEVTESAFKSEVQELVDRVPVSIVHARDSRLADELGHAVDDGREDVPMVYASRGPIEHVLGPDPDAYERANGGDHF